MPRTPSHGAPGAPPLLLAAAVLLLLPACGRSSTANQSEVGPVIAPPAVPARHGYRVVRTYPHDASAFTQGLVFHDGFLYEGTGLYGQSSVRQVELETGRVLHSVGLDSRYFGEGIAILDGRLVQLTWRAGTALEYELSTLRLLRRFRYPREGWGLTHDGQRLIASDGSSTLYFLDPGTMEVQRRVQVHTPGGPVVYLNELEWVAGEIYANVWQTDRLARISPVDGQVLGWIDLTGLLPAAARTGGEDVLNGIAWDAGSQRLFVTGKLWPLLFEIEVVPTEQAGVEDP